MVVIAETVLKVVNVKASVGGIKAPRTERGLKALEANLHQIHLGSKST